MFDRINPRTALDGVWILSLSIWFDKEDCFALVVLVDVGFKVSLLVWVWVTWLSVMEETDEVALCDACELEILFALGGAMATGSRRCEQSKWNSSRWQWAYLLNYEYLLDLSLETGMGVNTPNDPLYRLESNKVLHSSHSMAIPNTNLDYMYPALKSNIPLWLTLYELDEQDTGACGSVIWATTLTIDQSLRWCYPEYERNKHNLLAIWFVAIHQLNITHYVVFRSFRFPTNSSLPAWVLSRIH